MKIEKLIHEIYNELRKHWRQNQSSDVLKIALHPHTFRDLEKYNRDKLNQWNPEKKPARLFNVEIETDPTVNKYEFKIREKAWEQYY